MKIKKGKVYPSPSSSSSSSSSSAGDGDVFSVLKLLPATILTLASVLSLEDKEVLAYMITRSMKTTTNPQNPISSSSSPHQDSKKKSSKKPPNSKPTSINHNTSNSNHKVPVFTNSNHKVPIFDCDCFDCYTSYWFRWDSSANRELIHQAIEAFEDHLTNGERSKKQQQRGNNKRRDNKSGRRVGDKPVVEVLGTPEMEEESAVLSPEIDGSWNAADDGVSISPEKVGGGGGGEEKQETVSAEVVVVPAVETEDATAVVRSPVAGVCNHKGLARKVLPDVLGILNSRLWSLWGPNV